MLPRNLLTRTTEYTWPVYIADMGILNSSTNCDYSNLGAPWFFMVNKTQSMTGLFSSHTKLTKEGEF